jgi:hypothetical protein
MKPPAKRVINPTFAVVFIFSLEERSALRLVRTRRGPKPFKKTLFLLFRVDPRNYLITGLEI